MKIDIFTDGACQPNPGESGSGISIYQDEKLRSLWTGEYHALATNNIAELKALNHGFVIASAFLKKTTDITIHSDSSYSIKCMTEWINGWIKRNWINAQKQPVKNKELIIEVHKNFSKISDYVKLKHVKGHAGIEGNELADRMAIYAIYNKVQGLVKYTTFNSIQEVLDMNEDTIKKPRFVEGRPLNEADFL